MVVDDAALDSLCTRLVRDTFLVVERGHRDSITGTNDERRVLFCIVREEIIPQNCSFQRG
jgi:hypothetical protein